MIQITKLVVSPAEFPNYVFFRVEKTDTELVVMRSFHVANDFYRKGDTSLYRCDYYIHKNLFDKCIRKRYRRLS